LSDSDQFSDIPKASWDRAVARLTEVGVFADEEQNFLSAQAAASLLPRIQEKLESLGYSGGPLQMMPFQPAQDGASYLIFDSQRYPTTAGAQNAWQNDYESRGRQRVKSRVEDWLARLAELRRAFEQWIAESQYTGIRIVDKPPTLMHEDLMRRFHVRPVEMPTYEIVRDGVRLMRVQPKGLWVIGANGRVDLVTKAASLVLVDSSEPLSGQPDWQTYGIREPRRSTPLNKDLFLNLLQQAAA
jgi:hypothetical protein